MIFTSIMERKLHKLLEAANSFDDVSGDVVLVSQTNRNSTKLCLYDIVRSEPLAYISGFKTGGNIWQLDRIASQKGWGPLINDIFLMSLNPETVQPATMIKPDALNMWKFYYARRPDVKKVPLNPSSPNFATSYVDHEGGPEITNPGDMQVINTLYSMDRTPEYTDLVSRSEATIKANGISKSSAIKMGLELFWEMYGVPA